MTPTLSSAALILARAYCAPEDAVRECCTSIGAAQSMAVKDRRDASAEIRAALAAPEAGK